MSETYPASGRAVRRRPFLLSVITFIMIVSAVLSILSGILLLVERNDDDFLVEVDETSSTITNIGVGLIGSGVISFLLAMGLRRGSRLARAIVGIYEVLVIAGAIYTLVALKDEYRVSAIVTIGLSVLILYYLYGREASRQYFR